MKGIAEDWEVIVDTDNPFRKLLDKNNETVPTDGGIPLISF